MALHLQTNLTSQIQSVGELSSAEVLPLAPREPARRLSCHGDSTVTPQPKASAVPKSLPLLPELADSCPPPAETPSLSH